MRKSFLLVPLFLVLFSVVSFAQTTSPTAAYYSPDPMVNISNEMTKILGSVLRLTDQMKTFVEKFEKVGGLTFNEKQQKLVLGLEILLRAEARVAGFQKGQIDLTEKFNETRNKIAQIDQDLKPLSIDRSVAFAGTTQTEELRDSKRAKLMAEKTSLTELQRQIQNNLSDTNEALRDAQSLAARLRRLYLPQIERELSDQQQP
jgi:hypothetical protein